MPRARSRPVTYRQEDLFDSALLPLYTNMAVLNGDLEPHAHDFLEIAVVHSGSGRHVTAGGTRPARPGDVYVLRPGAWHAFASCRALVVANCCLGTSGLSGDLAFLQEMPELRELLWTGPVTDGRQGVLGTTIRPESATRVLAEIRRLGADLRRGDVNRIVLVSRLLFLLGGLIGPSDPDRDRPSHTGRAMVEQVVRAIDGAPERQWTVAQMAATVNIDPAYLSRLFRQHVGLPPVGYLARLRTERASVLLARTDLPVAQVGAAVGWSDPNYFARRFRTLSGLTPSAYREHSRADRQPIGASRSGSAAVLHG